MSFQLYGHHAGPEKDDLEGGKILVTPENTRVLPCYSHLFERGLHASWKLFGCCALMGLINVFSTWFTLSETTNLRLSDMLIESNTLLLLAGFLVSLFRRIHPPQCQSAVEQHRPGNRLSSDAKRCITGSFCIVLLSPALACLPFLAVYWLQRRGTLSYFTSGVPLILSWVVVVTMAALPLPYLLWRREEIEDYDALENSDETDGPTFLPQHLAPSYPDLFEGNLSQEIKATWTPVPNVSWWDAVEPPEALRGLVRWAISTPEESLPPFVASELLALAAISIGVHAGGMENWNQDAQYTYLLSRMCDRLAEIFQQAGPSDAVPEHALNVFLLVNQFEKFEEINVAALGADDGHIPDPELKRVVRCLKFKSASLLGC